MDRQLEKILAGGNLPKNLYQTFSMATKQFQRSSLQEYVQYRRKPLEKFKIIPDVYYEPWVEPNIKIISIQETTPSMHLLTDQQTVKLVGWVDDECRLDNEEDKATEVYIDNKRSNKENYINMRSSTTQKDILTMTFGAFTCAKILIKANGTAENKKPSKGVLYHMFRMGEESSRSQLFNEIKAFQKDKYKVSIDVRFGHYAHDPFPGESDISLKQDVLKTIGKTGAMIDSNKNCDPEDILGFVINRANQVVMKDQVCTLPK